MSAVLLAVVLFAVPADLSRAVEICDRHLDMTRGGTVENPSYQAGWEDDCRILQRAFNNAVKERDASRAARDREFVREQAEKAMRAE